DWTRACCIRMIGEMLLYDQVALAVPYADDPDLLLCETAWEALRSVANAAPAPVARISPPVEELRAILAKHQRTDAAMLSMIEKVLTLKSVEMFSETPEETLVDVAAIMQESEVEKG